MTADTLKTSDDVQETSNAASDELTIKGGVFEAFLDVQVDAWLVQVPNIQQLTIDILRTVSELLDVPAGDMSIVLADDQTVRVLNRDYRDKDKPTNVLSFAATEGDDFLITEEDPDSSGHAYGDIIVALETMQRESVEQNKTLHDHSAHLITHGVLHLLGFDHVNGEDAEEMEELEREILDKLGISDPYLTE